MKKTPKHLALAVCVDYIAIMRLFFLTLISFFIAISSACAAEAPRVKTFGAESFMLENGMRVVVIPNHRVPVITHMVWYGVGAADEAHGHSGLAHFLEHLMFKGTAAIPPGEFSKRIRALGGQDNAFTGKDFTAYFQSIAADQLETVMTMEADRMKNLLLKAEDVESELLVVIEERRQRTDNDPKGPFFEQMYATLFPNHPYGRPVVGWMQELQAMDQQAAMDFYKKWYAPNNAILVISGDTTAAIVKPLAEKIYGAIPAQPLPARTWPQVPSLYANAHFSIKSPDIRQPLFNRFYRVPSAGQNKQDSLALEVLASIMDHGQNSRLYKSLVVEQKQATDTNFSYDGTAREEGILTLGATPAEGISLEMLEKEIDKELRKLAREGVTDQEVREATTRLKDAYSFSRDSFQGPAMTFGYALITGSTIDDIEYWAYDIEAVTKEQINDVVRRYLDPDNTGEYFHVTGYVLPEQAQEAEKP